MRFPPWDLISPPHPKNSNPGSIWAYFPKNPTYPTGLFQVFFDIVSPILSIISRNREPAGFS